jgi:hypothetical protein
LALDDAIPKRENDNGPTPEFVTVTDTGSLEAGSCTDPKSTLDGDGEVNGALALAARADCAPVPAHAKAATAVSADTSLRAWWGQAANVIGQASPDARRGHPHYGWSWDSRTRDLPAS